MGSHMEFVGGQTQAAIVERVRGQDLSRCLVVPVDVGKHAAAALVADWYGQVVAGPMRFGLDEPGVASLLVTIDGAGRERQAVVCRIGVESAGHCHRTLVARLAEDGREVVELNPAHVAEARARQGHRRLKPTNWIWPRLRRC